MTKAKGDRDGGAYPAAPQQLSRRELARRLDAAEQRLDRLDVIASGGLLVEFYASVAAAGFRGTLARSYRAQLVARRAYWRTLAVINRDAA